MTNRKSKKFSTFLWHRRIGLIAMVLVIILSVTGIMLNHTERLKLDSSFVDSPLLLNWYGLEPDTDPISFSVDGTIISQWGQQIFFGDRPVANYERVLRGAIKAEQFIVIAFDRDVLLLTFEGDLVERIPTGTSFADTLRLGMKYQRPVIETADQLFYIADEHIIDWDQTTQDSIVWSQAVRLDDAGMRSLRTAFRGNGLSLERVILDLHSGRLFGHYGVYVMDAAAIALLWLCGSGLWVWFSRRRKLRSKRHFQKHHR